MTKVEQAGCLTGKGARERRQSGVKDEGGTTVERWGRHGCGPPGNDRTTHCDPAAEKTTLG